MRPHQILGTSKHHRMLVILMLVVIFLLSARTPVRAAYWLNLKPTYRPAKAPAVENSREDNESMSAPQKEGM